MRQRFFVGALVLACSISAVSAQEDRPFFRSLDPLAQRDSWGLLHQTPAVRDTDFAKRESWRLFYYSKSGQVVSRDIAYVSALQTALQRTGYYCGPIDGFYSYEVSDAIARLQKNYSMKVTGNLTVSVRRALYLP